MPEIDYVSNYLRKYNIPITGIIHVGAHKFEEIPCYNHANIPSNKIIWVEANKNMIELQNKNNLIIYNYCITDKEGENIEFKITNNTASSSILDFDVNSRDYPDIKFTDTIVMKTDTIKSLYEKENIPNNFANYLHLDIQGVELLALKGAGDLLNNFDFINTEVNLLHMYKDCALLDDIDKYLQNMDFIRIETDFGPGPRKTINGEWPGEKDYTIDGWGDALYIRKSKLTPKNIGERRH
jgi:FkbM family methyltransferase